MTDQEIFIARLRRHRERSGVPLGDIAQATRIPQEQLDAFERNDLAGWPRGLYARAWVRAYAQILGFDPDDVVDEFCRLFPQGDRRIAGTFSEMSAIIDSEPEYRDEMPHLPHGERRASLRPPATPAAEPPAALAWWSGAMKAAQALSQRARASFTGPFRARTR